MKDPRGPEESWTESLAAYRSRGGEPAAHPAAEDLAEAAGHDRWTARDAAVANARSDLASDSTEGWDQARAVLRWIIELMEDDELAEWFLGGMPEEVVQREERYAVEPGSTDLVRV